MSKLIRYVLDVSNFIIVNSQVWNVPRVIFSCQFLVVLAVVVVVVVTVVLVVVVVVVVVTMVLVVVVVVVVTV